MSDTTATGHVVGATYFSKYWRQTYTVLRPEITTLGNLGVMVKWEDGRYTTHSTHVGNDPRVS